MKKGFLGSLAALVLGGGVALAQAPSTLPPRAASEPTSFQGTPYSVTDDNGPVRGLFGGGGDTCQPRVWGDFDYLMWKFKAAQVTAPLVTTSTTPADGAVPADLGAIGNANTRVLYGNQDLSSPSWQSGYRLTIGGWIDRDMRFGVEGSGFIFNSISPTDFSAVQLDPTKVLAIPFVNTAAAGAANNIGAGNVGAQAGNNAFLLAGGFSPAGFPTIGAVSVTSKSNFWGAEINGLMNLYRDNRTQLNFLTGFRYLDLQEDLYLNYATASTDPLAGPNVIARFNDQFGTRNQFYGMNLGLRAEWTNGIVFASVMAKVALGVNHENVTTNGSYSDPAPVFYTGAGFGTGPGGFLTQRTNIGSVYNNRFAVAPETEIRVGVNLLSGLRVFVGYDFLYLNNVVRPGNQIDQNINITGMGSGLNGPGVPGPLVGAAQPAAQFNQTSFWAQGVNFGLQISY